MLKAGTPEKIDQEPIGTGPFYLVQYQKDAVIRYKAFPQYWGGKAKIDDLVFAITPDASVRWAKLQKGECHVMPYPNPADLDAIRKDPNVQVLEQPGLNVGYLAYNTHQEALRRRARAQGRSTWRSTRRPSSTACTWAPASPPRTRCRRRCRPTTTRSRTIPSIRKAPRSCWRRPAIPNGFTTDLWAMPVQRPYNPNAKRIAELMQADLAKIGVKAEIKTFEWGEYRKRMQAGEHQMGMLGWTGDNGDPDNFLYTLLGCDSAKTNGSNVAKFCHQPFEDLVAEGQDGHQAGRARRAVQEGAGDLQGAGALVHHRPRGAAQAGAQGSRRLQAVSPFGRHNFYGVDIKDSKQ